MRPQDKTVYAWDGARWRAIAGGGGGTVSWGDILGDITNQTDLINYIDSLINAAVAPAGTRIAVNGNSVAWFTCGINGWASAIPSTTL